VALETIIKEQFLPSIFCGEVSESDRLLYSLPCRMGGLGIKNPAITSCAAYETSRSASKVVSDTIKGLRDYNIQDNKKQIYNATNQLKDLRKKRTQSFLRKYVEQWIRYKNEHSQK
jgi:hypothetical protein